MRRVYISEDKETVVIIDYDGTPIVLLRARGVINLEPDAPESSHVLVPVVRNEFKPYVAGGGVQEKEESVTLPDKGHSCGFCGKEGHQVQRCPENPYKSEKK